MLHGITAASLSFVLSLSTDNLLRLHLGAGAPAFACHMSLFLLQVLVPLPVWTR